MKHKKWRAQRACHAYESIKDDDQIAIPTRDDPESCSGALGLHSLPRGNTIGLFMAARLAARISVSVLPKESLLWRVTAQFDKKSRQYEAEPIDVKKGKKTNTRRFTHAFLLLYQQSAFCGILGM